MKMICSKSGVNLLESQLETPIGIIILSACESGLHSVSIQAQGKVNNENVAAKQTNASDTGELKKGLNWLQHYFSNSSKNAEKVPDVPQFCFPPNESTDFQREVWETLFSKTNIGETVSYKDLATLMGRPSAARAVGNAVKKNPIPIIIPCHRVIKSGGELGSYSGGGGIKSKEFLLNHEKTMSTN